MSTFTSSGSKKSPSTPTRIDTAAGGPLWVRGDLRLVIHGEKTVVTRAALCRCRASANRPYCDGSGDCANWRR
jgi:Iron-binding zinc finger CDGSH type